MTTQHPEFSLKATADGFNVFSGPGNSYDRVKHGDSDSAIFILPRARDNTKDPASYVSTLGTTNTILGKYAAKDLWYRIQVANGSIDITGWIRAAHVESDDDLSGVPVAWKPIRLSFDSTANIRAVRSGPDADYDTVGSITAGTKYPVLGKDSDLDQDAWYEIQYDPAHPDCTGWVPAAQGQIHEAQDSIQQDDLPVTWLPPLIPDSLQLPVTNKDPKAKTPYYPITGLFNDPCRWWEPQKKVPLRHEGIDWGCGADKPIYAMAAGVVRTVVEDANHGSGKHVIVRTEEGNDLNEYVQLRTKDKGRGLAFELSYLHLNTVEANLDRKRVSKGDKLGTSGNTGKYTTGAHLHVHYVVKGQSSTVNWPDFFYHRNYQDFQAGLPQDSYPWPDTAALQAESDAAPEAGRDRLRGQICDWMEELLKGTYEKPYLRVKPGAKVYMFPKADARFRYPSRPLAHYAIQGRYAVGGQPHLFTDTAPWWWQHLEDGFPLWWKIEMTREFGTPYFPVLWVRDEDTEVIGDLRNVPTVPPATTDLPRYLKKGNGVNVRSGPNTHTEERDEDGNITLRAVNNAADPTPIINGWVPIVDLARDLTTKDYLWYQIRYHDPAAQNVEAGKSNAAGWVRSDVVAALSGSDPEPDDRAFPSDPDTIKPKVPADTTAHAKTQPNQSVPALPYPDEEARDPNALVYAFEGIAPITGCSEMSPLWYQLQLTDTRRGWVLADQVTTYNAGGLREVQPRLRRRLGSTAAIAVRNAPAATGTVLAAIGAADTSWHALRGRDAAYPGWWQVRYAGPVAGWVRSDQVQTHGSLAGLAATWDPAPQLSLRSTTTLGLNVRSGPGRGHVRVGFIAGGSTARYDILGQDAATATWYQIRFSPTVDGWVHGGYVRTHGSLAGLRVTSVPQLSLQATAATDLPVRAGPGPTHGQVGLIAVGSTDRYDILGRDAATAAWYQIQFSSTVSGWVDKDRVRTHGDLTGLGVTAVPQLSLKASTTDGLRVRSGPGTTHSQVASIAGGSTTKYDILGKDAATATWYQIRFSGSLDGWVHGDHVQFHGDLSGLGVTWVPQLSLQATAANGLAIHSGPGATHAQTGFIAAGSTARYDILGQDAATASWYQVRHHGTVDGWVKENDAVETDGCLDLAPPPEAGLAATAQSCAVRDAPAPTGTVQATITDRAERYPVLAKDAATAAWYRIRFSGSISGWVQAACVQLHGDGRNLPLAVAPTTDDRPRLSLASTTTAGLNLRTGPGEGHRILLTLPFNATRYDIVGKDADTAGWYEIRYGEGISGWVSEPHVQTHGNLDGLTVTWNPAPQLGLPTGAAYGLNVRTGPGEIHAKVGLITAGSTDRYDILGKDADAAGWYQIRFGATIGWVHAGYVQTHGDLDGLGVTWVPQLSLNAAATTGLAVYAGPGFGHTQVGFIAAGSTARYDILGQDAAIAGWYEIRYDATVTGWVPAQRVQTHSELDGLSATWVPQLSLAAAPYGLYVRSGPGREHDPAGVIVAGSTDRYDILGQDAATAGWYQIRFGATVVGWVSAAHVQTYGSLAGLAVTWVPQLSLQGTRTRDLNVHAGPGTTHDPAGVIVAGSTDRYDILGRDADPAAWYEIRFSATVTGWVSAAHVQTHGNLAGLEATWNPTPRLRLKAATTLGLNVRSGPDRAHNRIGFIKGGSTVEYEILGRNAATATWWQIRYSPTVPGWVSADHVQTRGDLTGLRVTWSSDPQLNVKGTNTIDLNVRTGPDAGHDRIGSIAVGSTVRYDILGKDAPTAAWYQIRFGAGVDGWVSAQWVRTHGDLGGLPVTWNPGPRLSLKPTTTSNLNVRTGPGTDHAWLGRIPVGSTVRYDILGKDAPTAAWYQIRFGRAVDGWVSADHVQTHGNLNGLAATWTPRLSLRAGADYNLSVRAGPGRGYAWIGRIPRGSAVRYDILGKDAARAAWYQIRFGAGVDGWVSADHVQTHGSLTGLAATWTPQLGLKASTTLGLNVRAEPDATADRVGFIKGGSATRYDILGRDASTAAWWQIRYSPTVVGWVSGSHVQTYGHLHGLAVTWTAPPQLSLKPTTTYNLNVRTGPGGAHPKVGFIPGGSTDRYDILGKDAPTATWYRIRFGAGGDGWVSADYVQTHGSLAGVSVAWVPGPQLSLKPTTTYNLNVRAEPDATTAQVGFIPGGSTARYDLLARSAATPTWYQIRFSDTVTGWVHGDYVQIHGSLVGLPVH